MTFRFACMINNVTVGQVCREYDGHVCSPISIDILKQYNSHNAHKGGGGHSMHANRSVVYVERSKHRRLDDLWKVNGGGGNDAQFTKAVAYLQQQGLLNFNDVIARHYTERPRECHTSPDTREKVCWTPRECQLTNIGLPSTKY